MKSEKDKIIETISWEYMNAYNRSHDKNYDIDTLMNFGNLGLHSIRDITAMFYSEIENHKQIIDNE